MADPPSRQPGWRENVPAPPTAQPAEEAWQQAQGPMRAGLPWWKSRRTQLAFVLSTLFLVAAAILAVVFWYRPVKPINLVLISTDYEELAAVPHNVWDRNGMERLFRLAQERNNWSGESKLLPLYSDGEAVQQALQFEKAPKTLVVFVSAHGLARIGADDDLVPYLVPQNDNLHEQAALYPLDRLLDALAALPERTRKLLLLDVTRVSAHWPSGQLNNDFARALAGRADRIGTIPNLVVLSSSDENQRSWASPEWGQTYFAHFVSEGLKGAADGADTGKKSGRVDALELFRYVRAEVERSAWRQRARWQTPVKLGDDRVARKLELVHCEDYRANDTAPEVTDEETDNKYYVDLKEEWKECRDLRRTLPHPTVHAPQLWRRYLDLLLCAEQVWRAGDAEAAKKRLEELKDLRGRIVRSRSLELKSAELILAMADALGVRLTENEDKKLQQITESWKKKDEKAPKENKKKENNKVDPFKDCDKERHCGAWRPPAG